MANGSKTAWFQPQYSLEIFAHKPSAGIEGAAHAAGFRCIIQFILCNITKSLGLPYHSGDVASVVRPYEKDYV